MSDMEPEVPTFDGRTLEEKLASHIYGKVDGIDCIPVAIVRQMIEEEVHKYVELYRRSSTEALLIRQQIKDFQDYRSSPRRQAKVLDFIYELFRLQGDLNQAHKHIGELRDEVFELKKERHASSKNRTQAGET